MQKLFILFIITGVMVGCVENSNSCEGNMNNKPNVSLKVIQMHHKILGVTSRDEIAQLIRDEPIVANYFLNRGDYPNDSIMVNDLYQRFSNVHIDTLQQEIDHVFGDVSQLTKELNNAFSMFKHYYPNVTLPKIKTVATGLNNNADLYVSDTLIVIGLDYYLGEGAKYRPIGFPNYIVQKYSQEYIVPSIMLLYGISPNINATDSNDKTMLADMITYGKSYYFAQKMLPCTPDSILMGYSDKEIRDSHKNIAIVWAHFLDRELLYNQDNFLKQKYLGERPKTYEVGTECPGRIGAWLGWEIVKQYADKKELELQELMKVDNAQQLFQDTKFRPGK